MMKLVFDVRVAGSRLEQVPRCFYEFVTIYNNSRYDFTIFKGNSRDTIDIIGACPAYTILTFPHEKITDSVNIVWEGAASPIVERCKIFFTEENMALVGEFRPPAVAAVATIQMVRENFGTTFFRGVIAVGTLFTATTICDVKSFYVTNTLNTAATVTLVHRRPGVADVSIVHGLSIAGNFTYAIGYIALEAGDSIVATAVTGTVHSLMYGVR